MTTLVDLNLTQSTGSGRAPEVIKVRVVTIDVSSIGIKFENFMQAGCRDLGSHRGCTMYC